VVVTRRFLVTGKVQGVYFRHSTRVEAERLALRGVARNLPDGSVEVIAHGEAQGLEALHRWLQRGPAMARVTGVHESGSPAQHGPPPREEGAPQGGGSDVGETAGERVAEHVGFRVE
jgi:acylphosphatase